MPASLPAGFSPLVGSDYSEGVTLRVTQFGQGYVQRSAETINAVTRKMTLQFLVRSNADARSLSTFLRDRATDPLQFQAPDALTTEFYLAQMPFKKTYIANGHGTGNGVWQFSCDFELTRF